MRMPAASADAAFVATWTAHRESVSRLAAELGRPHEEQVDEEHAKAAQQRLRQAGIEVRSHCFQRDTGPNVCERARKLNLDGVVSMVPGASVCAAVEVAHVLT